MIKYTKTHCEGSDCTAPYDIETDCKTVGEFVDEVLKTQPNDFGEFRTNLCRFEYKHGKLFDEIPQEFRRRIIIEVKAAGGWSNMNYSITSAEDMTEVVMYCKLHNDEHNAKVAAAGVQLAEKVKRMRLVLKHYAHTRSLEDLRIVKECESEVDEMIFGSPSILDLTI